MMWWKFPGIQLVFTLFSVWGSAWMVKSTPGRNFGSKLDGESSIFAGKNSDLYHHIQGEESSTLVSTTDSEPAEPTSWQKIEDNVDFYIYVDNEMVKIKKKKMWIPYFDPWKDTKMIIHGWINNRSSPSVTLIGKAYVKTKKYNVIVCDWSKISENIHYYKVAMETPEVGIEVGKFLTSLIHVKKVNYTSIHMIGHSLGAHVASAAGKYMDKRVARITCLDPAAICFEPMDKCAITDSSTLISPTDALFVDVIHTSKGLAGLIGPVGNADFYPNGGGPLMPGCESFDPLRQVMCSHGRAFEYFAESIENDNFVSSRCKDWNSFMLDKCDGKIEKMGDRVSHEARGIFYLTTQSEFPFALGRQGSRWTKNSLLKLSKNFQ